MEASSLADLHAYVDECLEPGEREAFEARMARDPALARRAAAWRAQNAAIRAAFDGEGAHAFSIAAQRQSDIPGGRWAPRTGGGALNGPAAARSLIPVVADASWRPPRAGAASGLRPSLMWRLGLAALSLGLAFIWTPVATVVPAGRLAEAGVEAFRAFTRPDVAPVELATGDREKAEAWLRDRLMRPVALPSAPSSLRLIGTRIAPYPGAPAAFLVYESREKPLGLLIRSLDAPAPRAPKLVAADGGAAAVWTSSREGFALAGDLDAPSLLKIATAFFAAPAEAARAAP